MLIAFREDVNNAPESMKGAIQTVEEYVCSSRSIHRFAQIFVIAP